MDALWHNSKQACKSNSIHTSRKMKKWVKKLELIHQEDESIIVEKNSGLTLFKKLTTYSYSFTVINFNSNDFRPQFTSDCNANSQLIKHSLEHCQSNVPSINLQQINTNHIIWEKTHSKPEQLLNLETCHAWYSQDRTQIQPNSLTLSNM